MVLRLLFLILGQGKMNCLFCRNPTECLSRNSSDLWSQRQITVDLPWQFYCIPCEASFQFNIYGEPSGRLSSVFIRCEYKDLLYGALFWPFTSPKFQLVEGRDDSWKLKKSILTLDFLPNINPSNFLEKLPTLLTFL